MYNASDRKPTAADNSTASAYSDSIAAANGWEVWTHAGRPFQEWCRLCQGQGQGQCMVYITASLSSNTSTPSNTTIIGARSSSYNQAMSVIIIIITMVKRQAILSSNLGQGLCWVWTLASISRRGGANHTKRGRLAQICSSPKSDKLD